MEQALTILAINTLGPVALFSVVMLTLNIKIQKRRK